MQISLEERRIEKTMLCGVLLALGKHWSSSSLLAEEEKGRLVWAASSVGTSLNLTVKSGKRQKKCSIVIAAAAAAAALSLSLSLSPPLPSPLPSGFDGS